MKIHCLKASKTDLKYLSLIYSITNKFQPHIIHSHLYKANILARLLKLRFNNVKVINHYHGLSLWMTNRRLRIEKMTQFLVDKAIVVSDKSYELRNEREGIPSKKLELIYNFVNKPEIIKNSRHTNTIFFGMACRLIKLKNIPHVIYLVKFLNENGVKSKLLIAGDGKDLKNIKSTIEKTNTHESVELLGFQENLNKFYEAIDIYIVSSQTEDLPLSMVEAMGYGCPVISTKVGGIPDVIKRGEGLIIPTVELDSFEIIKDYVKNIDFKKASKINSKLIREDFSVENFLNQMNTLYQTLHLDS